jgi:glutamyl-Q tRNA(Asp) synthetase
VSLGSAPSYRGRFAPSPTGALHFGSLVTAFASWLRARQCNGAWVIRIEDLDPAREVAGAAQLQLRTLDAYGMHSDEPVLWQSRRSDVYAEWLDRLRRLGLAFDCGCSRSQLAEQGGIHRRCVAPPGGRSASALRVRVPDRALRFVDGLQGPYVQQLATDVGDFIVQRVDGLVAYQLAVVVDDHLQQISEVVRGSDLLDSTPRQIWLQGALGFDTPAYVHLPLVLDANGQKLGKSQGALSLDPADPLPALRAAWRFLGQRDEPLANLGSLRAMLAAAVEAFDLRRVPATSSAPTAFSGVRPV